jgi:hypothetical protein
MLNEQQILAVADEYCAAEQGVALLVAQDIKWAWEGMALAATGAPVDACWNHVQRRAYVAWQQDDEYYADCLPAEDRKDWVGV